MHFVDQKYGDIYCETQAAPLRSVLEHSCEGRWMSLESLEDHSVTPGWLRAIVIVSPPIPGLTNKLINGSDPITTYDTNGMIFSSIK